MNKNNLFGINDLLRDTKVGQLEKRDPPKIKKLEQVETKDPSHDKQLRKSDPA
jgi:hypothetical protein